jgi:hypothetical protein
LGEKKHRSVSCQNHTHLYCPHPKNALIFEML